MDSVTQAALGAAVSEQILGKHLGNKAFWWGLCLGTLPDLDVLANPLLTRLEALSWHRGLSHSLLLAVLLSIPIAWCIYKLHHRSAQLLSNHNWSWQRCYWAVALIWITHIAIDLFTVYGTQIAEPFSQWRAASNNLFIIDPLFTLPLLLGCLPVLFMRTDNPWRRRLNNTGLIISTFYVAWSFTAKGIANQQFAMNLSQQSFTKERWISTPTPFNTLLWRAVVQSDQGYYIGYYSLFTPHLPIQWDYFPSGHELLEPWQQTPAVQQCQWFSKGYYVVRLEDERPLISDIRFGELSSNGQVQWIFNFHVHQSGNNIDDWQPQFTDNPLDFMSAIWQAIWFTGDPRRHLSQ